MLATLSLFLWSVGLFLVLKYRVHITIHVSTKSNRRGVVAPIDTARSRPSPNQQPAKTGQGQEREIVSALVNLGCSKERARQVAQKVCAQPGSFDELLRAAIREAA